MKKKKQRVIAQVVCLGDRFAPKNLYMLYQDETLKGTRLRIMRDKTLVAGVIFNNVNPRAYYFAMQKLSKKIGKSIQYVIVFQPVLPLETETYE